MAAKLDYTSLFHLHNRADGRPIPGDAAAAEAAELDEYLQRSAARGLPSPSSDGGARSTRSTMSSPQRSPGNPIASKSAARIAASSHSSHAKAEAEDPEQGLRHKPGNIVAFHRMSKSARNINIRPLADPNRLTVVSSDTAQSKVPRLKAPASKQARRNSDDGHSSVAGLTTRAEHDDGQVRPLLTLAAWRRAVSADEHDPTKKKALQGKKLHCS